MKSIIFKTVPFEIWKTPLRIVMSTDYTDLVLVSVKSDGIMNKHLESILHISFLQKDENSYLKILEE